MEQTEKVLEKVMENHGIFCNLKRTNPALIIIVFCFHIACITLSGSHTKSDNVLQQSCQTKTCESVLDFLAFKQTIRKKCPSMQLISYSVSSITRTALYPSLTRNERTAMK